MKKILFAMAILASVSVHAQTTDSTNLKSRHFAKKANVAQQLNLTEAQKSQWNVARKTYESSAKAIWNDASLSKEQKSAQMQAARAQYKNAQLVLLNPAQKQQLARFTADTKKHAGNKAHFGKEKGMKLAKSLQLTADQKSQAKSLRAGLVKQVQTIKSDSSLTSAQKKSQIKAAYQNSMSSFKSILTADQSAKLDSLQTARVKHFHGKKNN